MPSVTVVTLLFFCFVLFCLRDLNPCIVSTRQSHDAS